jgi:protoheme IX farnesyltransferase
MKRTRARGLPSGRISKSAGIIFGTLLGFVAFWLLYTQTHPLTAWIGLLGHLFYVLVYTCYLQPRTPQNIVIGGAAGAIGPLMGWAAGTGHLGIGAWLLFLWIVLWTPPHFWALALNYKKDYEKANIPMYPVVYGDRATTQVIRFYALSLVPMAVALYYAGVGSGFFLILNLIFSYKFYYEALMLHRASNTSKSMGFFFYSCVYAFVIFGALIADSAFVYFGSLAS